MSKRSWVSNQLLYISTVLAGFISISGLATVNTLDQLLFQIVLIPITLYLFAKSLYQLFLKSSFNPPKIIAYYNFIIATSMVAIGFLAAETFPQIVSAAIFSPLAIYFFLQVIPKRSHAIKLPEKNVPQRPILEAKPVVPGKVDFDRRAFLKLIGSAGVTVFIFTLFTKRAEAAFFGSVPGPGTISIKDSAGNKIDPSEKHPTDGYAITQLDDSTPAYYGYVNKLGQWFITKEEASGAYRYTKGNSDFSTNWTGRAALTYDYFDNVF